MSAIDSMLSDGERTVLNAYSNPQQSSSRRAIRLSIQYALGAAVFVVLAIYDNPLWSLAVYGIFLAWMIVRLILIGATKIAGVMPGIVEKYENRIQELEKLTER